MDIKRVSLNSVNLAPYNPRKNLQPGDIEYERLRRSLDEFGCVEPLVWNKRTGHLVGGHQRLTVLAAQGVEEIDVSVVDLSLEQEKVLNVALNKISGDWDDQKLAKLLEDIIKDSSIDLELTGFELLEAAGLIQEILGTLDGEGDDIAGLATSSDAAAITKPGELILLGRDPGRQHRLLCSDATDADAVAELMAGEKARLFMTDPPYQVGYTNPNRRCRGDGEPGPNWDDPTLDPHLYERFCRVAVDHAVADDAPWYCWHASVRQSMVEAAWKAAGVSPHQQIIWAKGRGVPGRSWHRWAHEPCLMGWQPGHRPVRVGQRKQTTVWEADSPAGLERPDHPTPKPVDLFERAMLQYTVPASPGRGGDVCYEPFAGSGSQFIAAQKLGRRCFGLELEPQYCDLIVRRFIRFAGAEAVSHEIAERYGAPVEGVAP